jgi:hypothetical protein
MAQVICSCGAVVSATRTATGWDIKLGSSSIQRNCEDKFVAAMSWYVGRHKGDPEFIRAPTQCSRQPGGQTDHSGIVNRVPMPALSQFEIGLRRVSSFTRS